MERFKSLHVRIWLALGILFITIVFVGMYVISFLYERLYVDEQINSLMTSGEELQSVYHNYDSESAFLWRVQWTDQSLGADVAFLTDEHPLISEGNSDNGGIHLDFVDATERQALESGETVVMLRNHPSYDQEILGVAVPLIENQELTGVILLSQPLASVYEPLGELRVLALLLLAIIIALLIVTGRVISLEAIKPIQQMQHTALKMAEGKFQERVHHQPRSIELKRLGESLNYLAQTLEEEEKTRRTFIGNVSHELRTPLSYIKGYAEAIEKNVVDQKTGITIIQSETESMLHLTNDLLDLTKLQSVTYTIEQEPVVFAEIVHDLITRMEITANHHNIQIQRNLDDAAIITGDAKRLEQVVRNLLDNAIHYSNPATIIYVSLIHWKDQHYRLTIQDEGVGIPKDQLAYIKDRFYRVNDARTRTDGGTGLGLAIVEEIIKKHHGVLTIESTLQVGTTVHIDLPEYIFDEVSS
ncbi:hypothetical protein DH09_18770 [Bacillaceae bacterium JMAK1]|nr:hypothetical protein DH09_18770 [Bacillaceae bacterium JMAK1]